MHTAVLPLPSIALAVTRTVVFEVPRGSAPVGVSVAVPLSLFSTVRYLLSELTNSSLDQKTEVRQVIVKDNKQEEAISALQVLGYQRKDIDKVMEQINLDSMNLEEIIKQALKIL